MIAAAQAAHQFVTFATATPLQVGIAAALKRLGDEFYSSLRAASTARRDLLAGALSSVGFRVAIPKGAYFILADFSSLHSGDDVAFVRQLVKDHGVAAIPPTAFYRAAPEEGRK